jgi:hypothetical protein
LATHVVFASVPYLSGVTSFDRPDGIAWTLAATDNLTLQPVIGKFPMVGV